MQPNDDVAIARPGPDLVRLRSLLGAGRAADVVGALGARPAGEGGDDAEALALVAEAHLSLGAIDPAVEASRGAARCAQTRAAADLAAGLIALSLAARGDAASLAEARRTLDPVLAAMDGIRDASAARVLHARGVVEFRGGRLEEARLSLHDALATAAACGDDRVRAQVHDSLAAVQARLGDTPRALTHHEASLRIRTALGDAAGVAASRLARGRLLLADGRPEPALAEFDACVESLREVRDPARLVVAIAARGVALTDLRRFDEAAAALHAAVRIAESGGHERQAAACTADLAVLADRRGPRGEAVALATTAAARSEAAGDAAAAGAALLVLGRLHERAGEKAAARAVFERAADTLRETPRTDLLVDALLGLAEAGPGDPMAPAVLDEAESAARSWFLRKALADAQRIRGLLPPGSAGARVTGSRNFVAFGRDPREYHLVERIPRSVQGEMWNAVDAAVGATVLVRSQPIADRTEEDRAAFEAAVRDFESGMRLDHRGVIRVRDFERVGRELFVATELVTGPFLRTRLREVPLEPAVAWAWIADIAAAVDALHGEGIVHRDLKPENVVFDAAGRPMVTDLGFAHVADRGGLISSRNVGTTSYAAPEQWSRTPADRRADLFTFGVIAAEILTGRNFLIEGGDGRSTAQHAEIMKDARRVAALANAVVWPDHVAPAARAALRRLVEHDPAARPASASAAIAECLGT